MKMFARAPATATLAEDGTQGGIGASAVTALPAPSIHGLGKGLVARLVALCVLLLIVANAFISQRSLNAITHEVEPQFNREAALVGGVIASQVARALELGMPLDRLVGMDEFLDPVLSARRAFLYLAVITPNGRVLYARGRQLDVLERAVSNNTLRLNAADTIDAGQEARSSVVQIGGLFNTAIPIIANGRQQAVLNVGVDASSLQSLYNDTRWDVFIVLLVSLLATIELLAFLVDRTLGTPLRLLELLAERVAAGDWTTRAAVASHDEISRVLAGLNAVIQRANGYWQRLEWKAEQLGRVQPRQASRLRRILAASRQRAHFVGGDGSAVLAVERRPRSPVIARLPLFIYIFAEQLLTSFMPLYARSLYRPLFGLDEHVLLGVPITVFMAGIAFATPAGGRLVRRVGPRRVFLIGVIPACLGYALAAFASSLPELILYRAVTAVGYSFITIGCQGYLASAAPQQGRARSMSVFVGAVAAGTACGTAVGAVIADRIGYANTFLASAALVLVSGMIVWFCMEPTPAAPAASKVKGGLLPVMRNPRFVALIVFAAIPAKIMLTGFIFYLAPLYLTSLNLSQPEIGRIIMSYALFMILTIGISARLSDRMGLANQQILWAGVLTGLGTVAVLFIGPAPAVVIAIITCGLCQGVAAAPMLAVIPEIAPEDSARLGAATLFGYLRMAERVGSMGGPFIAGGLVALFGYAHAIVWIGALSSVSAILFWITQRLPRSAPAGQVG